MCHDAPHCVRHGPALVTLGSLRGPKALTALCGEAKTFILLASPGAPVLLAPTTPAPECAARWSGGGSPLHGSVGR